MDAEKVGYLVGVLITPFLVGALIAFIYSKIKKRKFSRKVMLISAAIFFVLSVASKVGNNLNDLADQSSNFKDRFASSYIAQCQKDGLSESLCQCQANSLIQAYSTDELIHVYADYDAGKFKTADDVPETFKNAILACSKN